LENGETVEATTEHPFYVVGQGWKNAEVLTPGHMLTLRNGKNIKLVNVTYQAQKVIVYNLTVAEAHTFYIGRDGLLVHNGKKKKSKVCEEKCIRLLIGDGKPSDIDKSAVIETLRKVGGEKTINALYKALSQKILLNWANRELAIYTIGDLACNDERVIELLLTLRKEDENASVQMAAIGALGNIQIYLTENGNKMPVSLQTKIISHLRKLLVGETKHFNGGIRLEAASTLRNFKCEKSIAILKQVLVDEDEDVRREAQEELFYIEHGYTMPYPRLKRKHRGY
jgi:hypothetical protein